jgi:hypothetical protein
LKRNTAPGARALVAAFDQFAVRVAFEITTMPTSARTHPRRQIDMHAASPTSGDGAWASVCAMSPRKLVSGESAQVRHFILGDTARTQRQYQAIDEEQSSTMIPSTALPLTV